MIIADLIEGFLPLRGGGRAELFVNPSKDGLMALLDFSKDQKVRGLLLDDGVMWWDAYDATHSDVATIYDPDYESFETIIEYKKHRLELRREGKQVHLYAGVGEEVLRANPNTAFLVNPRVKLTTTLRNFS